MHRHVFLSVLPLIFTILIFISIHIPTSSCADNEQYTNCNSSYKCGGINITYPFWGAENRPEYCGYPGFEVACQNDVLTITISTISYRVLNNSAQTLTVVRQDYWDTYCPTSTSSLVNSTLDYNIFSYGSTSQNLTLNYGCPTAISGFTIANNQQYTCDINTGNSTGYYATRELTANELAFVNSLGSCSNSIKVSVSESAIQTLNSSPTEANLVAAIDGGFELNWSANNSLCDDCDKSGGQCGRDLTSGEFTCYCANGTSSSTCVSINNSPGSGKLSLIVSMLSYSCFISLLL